VGGPHFTPTGRFQVSGPPRDGMGHEIGRDGVELEDSGSDRPGLDDNGDLIIILLAGTLADLRDRLGADGYDRAARVVADLVEITDDYLERLPSRRPG
jgi:hypothetical protein